MKVVIAAATFCLLAAGVQTRAAEAPKTETRVGWLSNPTPGNWSLVAKDGEWLISRQGEEGALDGLPENRPSGKRWWVRTNSGDYGYGCMRITGEFDQAATSIVKITAAKALPLRVCRKDRALEKVEPK